MLDDQTIKDIFTTRKDLDDAVETFVEEANIAGGQGDIKIIQTVRHDNA